PRSVAELPAASDPRQLTGAELRLATQHLRRIVFAQPLVPQREEPLRGLVPRIGQRDRRFGNALVTESPIQLRLAGQSQRPLERDCPLVEARSSRRLVGSPALIVDARRPFVRSACELPALVEAGLPKRERRADLRRIVDCS